MVLAHYSFIIFFFFTDAATTEIYTLSLHDALPIYGERPIKDHDRARRSRRAGARHRVRHATGRARDARSEEHTSELQSPDHLVCRLLLEKKKQEQHESRYNEDETTISRPCTSS